MFEILTCTTHKYDGFERGIGTGNITLRLILSICLFWFSSSDPMSRAIFRKLPTIVFTWPIFSSISSSRASFVILKQQQAHAVSILPIRCFVKNHLPSDVAGLRSETIAIVHDSLWLVVNNFAVVVALPCAVVLFERCTPVGEFWLLPTTLQLENGIETLLVARQYTNSATLLHSAQVLLGFSHVSVDLIHALLNAVELL